MNRWAASVLVFATASSASADRRVFTHTYEYRTVHEGATAVELWHTESRTTWHPDDAGSASVLESILEIEHGLTERWDAGLHLVATQLESHDPMLPSQAYAFDQLALETRYRFADRGELPIDILAHTSVAKQFGAAVFQVEGRGVFARDMNAFTAALNVIAAAEFGPDAPQAELELGWAAGVSYELHPKFSLGAETYGTLELEDSELLAAVGPAFAFAPSSSFWVTVTTSFGFEDAPAVTGRLVLGIEL